MRIFVQTIYFPPRLGGIENHAYYLCRGLALRGHKVRVVTSRTEPDSASREREGDLSIHRVSLPVRNIFGWVWNSLAYDSMPRGTRNVYHAMVRYQRRRRVSGFSPLSPMRNL